jgi:hypothetical protein
MSTLLTSCLATLLALLAFAASARAQDIGPRVDERQARTGLIESSALGGADDAGRASLLPRRGAPGAGPDARAGGGGWPAPASLVLVLGAIVASAFAVRALARRHGGLRAALGPGGRSPAGVLEVLGRYPLGRGHSLVLLKLHRSILLVSHAHAGRLGSGAGMSTLLHLSEPEAVAAILQSIRDEDDVSLSSRFARLLDATDARLTSAEHPSSRRRILRGRSGDRAELWDDRAAIPVVDLTARPRAPRLRLGRLRARAEHARAPGSAA